MWAEAIECWIMWGFAVNLWCRSHMVPVQDAFWVGLCCLMTSGLSKGIRCHVWPYFFTNKCKSADQTSGHTKSAVSLVILHMVTSIFLQGLCGYIWVNILTLSPRRLSIKKVWELHILDNSIFFCTEVMQLTSIVCTLMLAKTFTQLLFVGSFMMTTQVFIICVCSGDILLQHIHYITKLPVLCINMCNQYQYSSINKAIFDAVHFFFFFF